MCRATANVVGYANWEASITCSKPYENVWYKLDEELEEESCRTGQEVTTRLDGNGFDYCRSMYCNDDYAQGCEEGFSCSANDDGYDVCQ